MEVKITQDVLSYIEDNNKHVKFFEVIPQLNSIWNVDRIISYPNVCNGEDVIELSNNKGGWLRLPLKLFTLKDINIEQINE